jgi:hypothetical protein
MCSRAPWASTASRSNTDRLAPALRLTQRDVDVPLAYARCAMCIAWAVPRLPGLPSLSSFALARISIGRLPSWWSAESTGEERDAHLESSSVSSRASRCRTARRVPNSTSDPPLDSISRAMIHALHRDRPSGCARVVSIHSSRMAIRTSCWRQSRARQCPRTLRHRRKRVRKSRGPLPHRAVMALLPQLVDRRSDASIGLRAGSSVEHGDFDALEYAAGKLCVGA